MSDISIYLPAYEMVCPCALGLHGECIDIKDLGDGWATCCCSLKGGQEVMAGPEEPRGVGRPVSDPEDIKDIISTGRKRATMLYPIMDGMLCEWSRLRFAGGGISPIIGCDGNLIYDQRGKGGRHHGPDKNVIVNDPGNVHRICMFCHNRWHALNNEWYETPRPPASESWLPDPRHGVVHKHDPNTLATDDDIEESEAFWATRKLDRVDTED